MVNAKPSKIVNDAVIYSKIVIVVFWKNEIEYCIFSKILPNNLMLNFKYLGILLGDGFRQLDDCPTCVVEKVWE